MCVLLRFYTFLLDVLHRNTKRKRKETEYENKYIKDN